MSWAYSPCALGNDYNSMAFCLAHGMGGDLTVIGLFLIGIVGLIIWRANFGIPVALVFGAGFSWVLMPLSPSIFGGIVLLCITLLGILLWNMFRVYTGSG